MKKIETIIKKYNNLSIQIRASFFFLLCSFLEKAIAALTTPIFTRLMSTDEYGQYTVFTSWENILSIFISLNLFYGVYSQGLVKFNEDQDCFAASLQGLVFVRTILYCLICSIFRKAICQYIGLEYCDILMMLCLIMTTSVYRFWAGKQRISYKYKRLVFFTFLICIIKPILELFLMYYMNNKVRARIMGWLLAEVVAYSWMFFEQCIQAKKLMPVKYWLYALRFNIPLIPHYLSQTILNSADRIMIQKMDSNSNAGIYSLSYSLSLIMTIFNTALTQSLEPWMLHKIKEKKVNDIPQIFYFTLFIVATVNLFVIAFAPEIISIFAPKSFYNAIWVIPPIAMSVFFMYMYGIFSVVEFYFEKTFFVTLATVISALVNIMLNYVFIGFYGYIAAGYTTLVCYILYALGHYTFMNRICNEEFDYKKIFDIKIIFIFSVSFIVMSFSLMASYKNLIMRYSLIIIMFIIVFLMRNKIMILMHKIIAVRKDNHE